jgi:RNA polymerase sigma-70 factor (ECF subfamily)
MHPMSQEEELIREAKAASPEAWARIYDAYAQKVYLYALGRTGNHQAAEDITSTVFLKALKAISLYKPGRRPFLAWLYGVARHTVADHFRKLRPAVSLERAPDVVAAPMPGLEHLDLRAAMAKLSGTQREVVALYYYAGYSVAEIADMLEKNESAVYSLHARALRALRDRMSEREDRRIFSRGRLISRISSEKLIRRKKIDG